MTIQLHFSTWGGGGGGGGTFCKIWLFLWKKSAWNYFRLAKDHFCAFITWVRRPSILFTFILRRCHAFIIHVIVVIRRSIIFKDHSCGIWSQRENCHPCSTGFQHVTLSNWAYFHIWAMRLTRLIFVHHSLPWWWGGWNKFLHMLWHFGSFFAFWIRVSGHGHHWLLCPSWYTTCMRSF